ncbi:FG-GAP-like repeat-containing protein [Rhodohalobacter sp. 8-1]|uniref:FG-GAP-like repeat-containing protein n=1 Tax=Rhodohalobacter sp. 8-1 TaxID=3131972 RepID=UPI0030EC71F0
MHKTKFIPLTILLLAGFLLFFSAADAYGQFTITERTPAPQSTDVIGSDPIEIEFSQDIDFSTAENSVFIHSSLSGSASVEFEQIASNRIRLIADCGYIAGEVLSITVTTDLLTDGGIPLSSPQQWRFTILPEAGSDRFTDTMYELGEGSEPSAIQAIDINNNKLSDLVVINSNNSEVTVLENQIHITGEYLVRNSFETGIDPNAGKEIAGEESRLRSTTLPANSSITSADLNRDGYPDLVVAATLSNQLILLQNRADGQLDFDVELIDTGDRPVDVVAADMNNNGYRDLVVAAAGSDDIVIHYNNGDGTFASPISIGVGFVPLSIVVDDVNNSGYPDIVAALSGENRVAGLINDGEGNFSYEILIDELAFTPTFILLDNFTVNGSGDDFPDILLGSSDETDVYLYENISGSYALLNTLSSGQLTRPVFGISADPDANGILDLISSHFGSGNILLNFNNSAGFTGQAFLNNLSGPVGLTSSDFNDDGSIDLAVTNQTTGEVTVLLNEASRAACLGGNDLAFGDVCLGESVTEEIQVTNFCPFPLGVQVSLEGNGFSTDVTGFEIDPGDVFSVPVTFAPEERGFFEGAVTMIYNRACGVLMEGVEFELSGRGIESDLETPDEVAFGDTMVGTTVERTATILNTGNTSVDLELTIESDENVFNLISPGTITLGPNQDEDVLLSFIPDNIGDFEGELVITATSDCGVLEYRILLTGTGTEPITELTLPDLIDFGEVEINLTESSEFVITNSGNVDIDIELLLQGQDPEVFDLHGPETYSIPAGDQQSVTMEFSPVNTVLYTADLQITGSSDFDNIEYTIPVRGTGIEPLPDLVAVQISAESISGDYLIGQSYRFDASFQLDRDEVVSDPFDLIFLVNDDEQERIRFTETLNPGDARSFTFEHSFSREGTNEVRFVVDPEDEIDESTTENNSISTTIQIQRGSLTISPNPFTPNNDGFNDEVDFDFSRLGTASNPTVRIFSFNGRLVQTLRDLNSGSIQWDGRDSGGNYLTPGVYLYVVEENNQLLGRGSITLAL